MQIVINYDEQTRRLEVKGPTGVSPLLIVTLLSQSVTALTAPMVGGGHDLILPAQAFKVQ